MKRTVIPFPIVRSAEDQAVGERFDRVPEWLRRRRGLSWSAKALWAFLAGAPERRHMGLDRLGSELAVSRNTVRRSVESLERAGLLVVHSPRPGFAATRIPIHPPEVLDE